MKWITEFFKRFGMKTPGFFQVIQMASIICGVIAGIPALLAQFETELGINIPDVWESVAAKVVAFSSAVAWIISNLPVQNPERKSHHDLPFSK